MSLSAWPLEFGWVVCEALWLRGCKVGNEIRVVGVYRVCKADEEWFVDCLVH